MTHPKISRRKAIESSLAVSVAAFLGYGFKSELPDALHLDSNDSKEKLPMRISLNTSTILAYKLPVDKQIGMVAEAGFEGIELWMNDVKAYLENGGQLETISEKLQTGKLTLENMIAFSQWCSDDPEVRKKAIDQLREEMLLTARLGGKFIAAPVQGLKTLERDKFDEYTRRYTNILALEKETGVTPILELWGAGALNKLSDGAQIVIATGHPKATLLLDFYHLHRGGNSWDTLDCLNGKRLPVIHMNDYPSSPAREALTDADRVLPGEGVCPFNEVLPKLYDAGFRGGLSVELFNRGYWETMDAGTLLKTSYEKTYQVVKKALSKVRQS